MRDMWQDERLVYRRPGLSPAWRAAVLFASLALAAATGMLMPFAELFTAAPAPRIEFRPVETVTWRPTPPPPPRRVVPPPPVEPVEPQRVVPKPTAPRPMPVPLPVRLPVKLDFSLAPLEADLALNFSVDPAVETLPETIPAGTPPAAPPPEPEPVEESREPDQAPAILSQVDPVYPYRARTQGIEGYVDLVFVVTPEGTVEQPEAVAADPPGLFEPAAIRAVTRWRFAPAMRGSEAVPARVQIRIRFALDQ